MTAETTYEVAPSERPGYSILTVSSDAGVYVYEVGNGPIEL